MNACERRERETLAGLHCRRGSNGRHRQTYIREENYVLYIYVNEPTMMARKKFNEEVMLFHTSEIKLIDSRFFLIHRRAGARARVFCQTERRND